MRAEARPSGNFRYLVTEMNTDEVDLGVFCFDSLPQSSRCQSLGPVVSC
jgi:hypothetical protein